MSTNRKVGISDIAIYLPRLKIKLETIIQNRAKESGNSKLERILTRTLQKTGLLSMHFPEIWEDTVTMAAEAAAKLIKRKKFNLGALRYLVSGTETTVDHSKPLAAYVMGILKKAGIKIPRTISTFQTQHACAGGTLALLGIAALLGWTGSSEESGIVMCSDIARYEKASPAEMTQGAGAVAMLTETNPKLVELEIAAAGYSSEDVDDFFRPLGSDQAKVKGSYSVRCYMEAMESALLDHASRVGGDPGEILREADMFALHAPYPKLPEEAMKYLLNKYLCIEGADAKAFLDARGFFAMTYPASRSGNVYTGSMFMSLAFLLKDRFEKFGDAIAGKKILMGSYGSGNTMVFMPGTIAQKAPDVIKDWDLESIWQDKQASIEKYARWVSSNGISPSEYARKLEAERSNIHRDSIFLGSIREDGYREYQIQE